MKRKKKPRGTEAFEAYYRDIYTDRWDRLKAALLGDGTYIEIGPGLNQPYFIDEASTIPAAALGVEPGDAVLDLCAAPGGKTLLLALAAGSGGSLVSNDRSSARRGRLKRVIEEHLPEDLRNIVTVTGHDASRWCLYQQDAYDRVLLDAPCSSERHVLGSPGALEIWSPARPDHLARQAFSMLASALRVVKPGGIVVYSTCSLTEAENDGTVGKLLKRYPQSAELLAVEAPWGERTACGLIILPDVSGGRGPIYCAKIRRRDEH